MISSDPRKRESNKFNTNMVMIELTLPRFTNINNSRESNSYSILQLDYLQLIKLAHSKRRLLLLIHFSERHG